MNINDIPRFTSWGDYFIHVEWGYLSTILSSYKDDNLQLEPDFQRGHVWSIEQQISYIEFCLKGGRTGKDILFNNPNWTHQRNEDYKDFVLVDGLQRITAVTKFMDNQLPIFGNNYLKDFNGSIGDIKRQILRGQIFIFHINDLQSKKEVLQWYIDLNSGGVVHSQEELDRVRKLIME